VFHHAFHMIEIHCPLFQAARGWTKKMVVGVSSANSV
jgi:hypothetical protein